MIKEQGFDLQEQLLENLPHIIAYYFYYGSVIKNKEMD